MLDYDYIKIQYRLIAVDLSRQKELDADPKAIQHIEFVGQLEKPGNNNTVESMFILTILEKNQRNKIKMFTRKCNINNGKQSRREKVKLTNAQLNKL